MKDLTSGECYRADHLLKDHLEKLSAEPKCTSEKKQEYSMVITKVRGVAWSGVWFSRDAFRKGGSRK